MFGSINTEFYINANIKIFLLVGRGVSKYFTIFKKLPVKVRYFDEEYRTYALTFR